MTSNTPRYSDPPGDATGPSYEKCRRRRPAA